MIRILPRGARLVALVLLFAAAAPHTASAAMNLLYAFPNMPGFDTPTGMVDPLDGTDRLFVIEKDGFIHVFQNDFSASTATLFLTLEDSTANNFESGLCGLAFHPDYKNNGYFYVTYINKARLPLRWVLERYHVSADPNVADPTSAVRLLEIPQVNTYHKAGQIVFGADGYMYVTVGEDGQYLESQQLTSLKGKMIRIDVDHPSGGKNYGIPPDNPFVGNTMGYREEIWAYGFRNPWRFTFDKPTGRLWLGDVGLDTWEEVDIVKKGRNYGWPRIEGTQCDFPTPCDTTGLNIDMPLFEYIHYSQYGAAVIGGYVYHGTKHPELQGAYIYADHPTDHVWALTWDGVNPPTNKVLVYYPPEALYRITGICQDKDNELFFVGYYGGIYELVGTASGVADGPQSPPPGIFSAQPNPFVGETRIHFSASGPVSIQIYDVSGRLVQRIESSGRGERDAVWDGTSLGGRRATSGVYFARLMVDGKASGTRRIVLVK